MWIYVSCLLVLPAVEFNPSQLKGGNNQWKPSVGVSSLLFDWHLCSCFTDSHSQLRGCLTRKFITRCCHCFDNFFIFPPCFMWVFRVIKGRDQNADHHWPSLLPALTSCMDTRLTAFDSSRHSVSKGIISQQCQSKEHLFIKPKCVMLKEFLSMKCCLKITHVSSLIKPNKSE